MKAAMQSWLGQRTTIQGLACLVFVVALFKFHIITNEAASAGALAALTLIGLPETAVTVRQSEPVKLDQPIVAATVPARSPAEAASLAEQMKDRHDA